MRVRAFYWMSLLVTALFLVGCGGGQATVKFQPGDQNVTPGQTMQWTFDTYSLGEIPKGAQSLSGRWEVRAVADAPTPPNALCQTGNAEFPALSLSPMVYTDVVISTRFKPISGQQDQAAGIIFRIQDANNYDILRANALENNVTIYRYVNGARSSLQEGTATVVSGKWQELRVEVKGDRIRGFLNGKLVVETTDETYKAGQVGLWTKSDSVTCFDNVRVMA